MWKKKVHILMADDKPDNKRPTTPNLDQRLKEAKINSSSSPVGSSKDLLIAENKQDPQDKVISDYKHKMSDSVRNYCLKLLEGDLSSKPRKELFEIYWGIFEALTPYPEVRELFESVSLVHLETKGKEIFTEENLAPADVRRMNSFSKLFQGRYERPENVIQMLSMVQNFMLDKGRLACTALVQSPGSGKSRLIKELAKTLPTLYVCMGGESSQAYPPRSESMKFFDSLEHYVGETSKFQIFSNSLLLAIRDLSSFWLEQKCNVRGDILESVWRFQESSTGFFKEEFIEESTSAPLSQREKKEIWDNFGQLTKEKGKKTGNQSPVKIMLVFDEARYLLEVVDGSNDRQAFTLYKALKNVLREERNKGIFGLLVDTMSRMSDFIPAATISDRGYYMNQHMPLCQLDTFDVGLIGHQFTLDLHADPYLFLKMGRPLWKLLDNEYKDVSKAELHFEERLKLAHSCLKGENHMLAALMIIYDIAIKPNPVLAQSLVSCHMAFMTVVGPNNQIAEVRYRSEPLLALCAHNLIREQEKLEEETSAWKLKKSVFERLTELLNSNVISTGERGELLARILLTRPTLPKETVNVQTQFRTMNVAEYLKRFGVEVLSNLVSTHGIIHLSHWTRAETPLTLSVLVQAWYRGCGIICKACQEAIDLIIPIFINDEEGKNHKVIEAMDLKADSLRDRDLSKKQADSLKRMMSMIAVQVKTNPNSRDGLTKAKFIEKAVPIVEDCCSQPSYLMHWDMYNGKPKVVVEQVKGEHTYVKRVGLDDLGLSSQELLVANSLVLNVVPQDSDVKANELSRDFNLFFKDFQETSYADYLSL